MQRFSWTNARQRMCSLSLFALGVLIVLGLVITVSYIDRDWPEWTGFGRVVERIRPSDGEVVEYQHRKTLWDLLDLLIVPAILAVGAYWLQRASKQREEYRQEQQAQETTLQGYLDKITDLLIKEPSLDPQSQGLKPVMVRSRTLTALGTLDNVRRGIVLKFLYESNLITAEKPFFDLSGANFSHAFLRGGYLRGANLSQVTLQWADLSRADFSDANLSGADLKGASLTGAILHGATLRLAKLSEAQLSGARFYTGKLTREELSKLPPDLVLKEAFDSFQSRTSSFENFEEKLLTIERIDKEFEVKALRKQLADITERQEAWLKEGKEIDPDVEKAVQELHSGELDRMKADAERALEEAKRKYSPEYSPVFKKMKREEREVRRQLERAEQELIKYERADLRGADLTGANLHGANLWYANCRRAILRNSDLRRAVLINADLSGADLKDADLRGAVLSEANITKEQLASVKSVKGAWRDGRRMNGL